MYLRLLLPVTSLYLETSSHQINQISLITNQDTTCTSTSKCPKARGMAQKEIEQLGQLTTWLCDHVTSPLPGVVCAVSPRGKRPRVTGWRRHSLEGVYRGKYVGVSTSMIDLVYFHRVIQLIFEYLPERKHRVQHKETENRSTLSCASLLFSVKRPVRTPWRSSASVSPPFLLAVRPYPLSSLSPLTTIFIYMYPSLLLTITITTPEWTYSYCRPDG